MSAPAGVAAAPSRWQGRLVAAQAALPSVPTTGVLFALLMLLYVLLSFDAQGVSNDEQVQHLYGRLLLDYYGSGLRDHGAFEFRNLYLYGGLFDMLAALLERGLGLAEPWAMRHLLSAGFGLAGMLAAWRLAQWLGGARAGLLAALLLALTGAWSGGQFTHTKDVPFATCMSWALYYTLRLAPTLPRPPLSLVLKLGVALGCAFGLRVGAVFAVLYLGATLAAGALLCAGPGLTPRLRYLIDAALALLPAALVAIALMGLFWPWSVQAPGNLLQAVATFKHAVFVIDTLFDGQKLRMTEVPANYLLTYLSVRLPELALLGLASGTVAALRWHARPLDAARRARLLTWLPLVLAVLFPLGYTLASAPPLYNGIRHFLFLLPPVAALAALGLRAGWRALAGRRYAGPAYVLLCVGLASAHALELARLHPYQYVAYNHVLGGGSANALPRWETDYWSASLRESAAQLNGLVAREGRHRPYLVAVCAEPFQAGIYLGPGLLVTTDWRAADFFLSTTQLDCHHALKGRQVGGVQRLGMPLSVLLDRRALVGEDRKPR